jgi:hypothetical protein
LCKCEWGGLTHGALATWSVFFFFFYFSLLNPPFPLQALWDPFVHKCWGPPSARAVPFRSRTRGVTLQSAGSSFVFFRSLTDPPLSHISDTLSLSHCPFLTHHIFFMRRVTFLTPRVALSSPVTPVASRCHLASYASRRRVAPSSCFALSRRLTLATLCGRAMQFLGCPMPRPSAQC